MKNIKFLLLIVVCLFSALTFGQTDPIRFTNNIPSRVKLIEPVTFNFTVDKNIVKDYRFKLKVPMDWLGGILYSLKSWSDWYENEGSNVTFSDFKIEGTYKFIIQYREYGSNSKKEVTKELEAYWEYPEVRTEGYNIDYAKANKAPTKKRRYEILAKEYYKAYETWGNKFDYEKKLLKLTTSKKEILSKLGAVLVEESAWKLTEIMAGTAAKQWLQKLFLPKTLYDLIKEGFTDLIIIMRRAKANEASFMTVLNYYLWKYCDQKSKELSDEDILLGFILDSSGSMKDTDPYNIRKSATKQIIDILNGNEKVFIVDFDDGAHWINSNNWENWDRNSLKSSINTIDSEGGTNIGNGIDKMRMALQDKLTADTKAAVILLTDGNGKYNDEARWFRDHDIPIYTISYKDKAVSVLMNNIARTTNGLYIKANNESEIVSAFTQFYNALLGNSKLMSYNGMILPGQTIDPGSIYVDPTCQIMNGGISYLGSKIGLMLTSPGGIVYTENGQYGEWTIGSNYTMVKIINPESGEWKVKLEGIDIPVGGEPFTFEMSADSPNKIDLVEKTQKVGPIEFELKKNGGSFKWTKITPDVKVTTPKNVTKDISGNYSAGKITYMPLDGKGDYQFDVKILATDKSGNKIQRFYKRTVLIDETVSPYILFITNKIGAGFVIAEVKNSIDIKAGDLCHFFNKEFFPNKSEAIGYVVEVQDRKCIIRIQMPRSGQEIAIGDIVKIDLFEWNNN